MGKKKNTKFKPPSLKGKFFLFILPPVVIGFFLTSLVAGILSYYDMKSEIREQSNQNVESFARLLGMSLWNMDDEGIDAQVAVVLSNPDISGVKVFDRLGGRVYQAGEVPNEDVLDRYIVSTGKIRYMAIDKPGNNGTLTIYTEKGLIYKTLVKRFLRDSFLFLMLVLTVIISTFLANQRTVLIPLKKLVRSIRSFNDEKKFVPVVWSAEDEIGEVISAYNGLIISLEMSNTQVKDALKEARKANQVKGEFLANMSHEIRTPLNGIMGMAELVLETRLDADQETFVKTINMESESLLHIINDILDFSKIEAGKLELDEIPFDLRNTIENLSATLAVTANKKQVEFIHYLEPKAYSRLMGDPGRLRQIFLNLAGNSVKFTHEGEVFIKGEMIGETEQTARFLFTIKDTGIGIPAKSQKMVFNSFSQVDGSTTRKYGGTGLGITISKMLVEKMGGTIGLNSTEGVGTEFWFELEFGKQVKPTREYASPKIDLDGLRVLIVDDVKTNRDIYSKHLDAWGCIPVVAESGASALETLTAYQNRGEKFDVILTDFQMPVMNGFDFTKKIRQTPAWENTPLILLTSMGSMGDGKMCRSIGVDGYLTKPVRQQQLKQLIGYVIGQAKQPDVQVKKLATRHTLAEEKRKNIRILLADDYETNQKLTIKQLEDAGFHVTLARDGQEAVALFCQNKFNLILMDIQMPRMDGYEATSQIRKLEKGETRIPIVALTAHAIKGYRNQCMAAGMDDYITKPMKKEVLLSTVSKWVQNQEPKISRNKPSTNDTGPDSLIKKYPCFDMAQALVEFENDKAFMLEVFQEFLQNLITQKDRIQRQISVMDFQSLAKEAHSIKGGAANLCAMPLSRAASAMEACATSKNKLAVRECFKVLCNEINSLRDLDFDNQI